MGSPDFGLDDQLTVLAWARWNTDPATGKRRTYLLSTSKDNRTHRGPFQLQHRFFRGQSRFAFVVRTRDGSRMVQSKTEPQPGVWYHLAGVYDGQRMRLYVDGIQEGIARHHGAFPADQPANLYVACRALMHHKTNQCTRGFLAGQMDEIRIFRTALSPGEILVLRDETRTGPNDETAPEVVIHKSDGIANSFQDDGFLLSGTVSDDSGVASMEMVLSDDTGEILRQIISISAAGHWAISVDGSLLTAGQSLHLDIETVDGAGNRGHLTQTFTVAPADNRARHLVNRMTFGATVPLLKAVHSMGPDVYLEQQLNPHSIDVEEFDTFIDAFEPVLTKDDLQVYVLMRTMHSPRQLEEVMTAFWDNHFSTDINKHGNVDYEFDENRTFRNHALGRFRDLLETSAKSPAMLIYLDAVLNIKGEPNENYARELLELHTMGVDGGYTQGDVEGAAKIFTGWQVREGAFFFNADRHDTSEKEVLGHPFPGTGAAEGEALLELLAGHPSTAWFICEKLAVFLVHDFPTYDLVFGCVNVFLDAADMDDQIAQVVRFFLTSPEFNEAETYRSKVITPLEIVLRTVRGLHAASGGGDLPDKLRRMGQRLFENPVPTGYGETGEDWINSNQLLERIRFVNRIARNAPGGNRSTIDPVAFFSAHGYETAEAIVGFSFQLMFGISPSPLERGAALDVLTDRGTQPCDLTAANADVKLRRLLGTIMSFPGYQYQ